MRFVERSEVRKRFEGKRVAIVGSGPGVLENVRGFVDSHEVVVRVNNFKLSEPTGFRCDSHYSFYGNSIKKTKVELKRAGVTLCICKCPNGQAMESEWHRARGKMHGVDFRWIYEKRAPFWFCDTYVPTVEAFLVKFHLLGQHVPTTGFAAILDVLGCNPKAVYLTGFDFFRSGLHNVNEPWREKNVSDPIGHEPERELKWLADNLPHLPVTCDPKLTEAIASVKRAAA